MIAEGSVTPIKRKRSYAKKTKPVVKKTTVVGEVWKTAILLAGHKRSRIQVLSEDTVIVHNNEDWRKMTT